MRVAGRARSCRSPPPRSAQASTPSSRPGLDAPRGPTDVLVADADAVLAPTAPGEVALTERPAPRGVDQRWAACEERPDAEEQARVVLARIEPAAA